MGEANQFKWVGVRPTEPEENIPIKTDYSKASVKAYAADGTDTHKVNVTNSSINVNCHAADGTKVIPVFQNIPENAQKVCSYNYAENAWAVVYTVPSGKLLYLCLAILMVNAAANGEGMLCVFDNTGIFQYCLAVTRKAAGDGDTYPISFPIPLEIPSGWEIRVYSSASSFYSYSFILGYLL